jgi:hypothetical protein
MQKEVLEKEKVSQVCGKTLFLLNNSDYYLISKTRFCSVAYPKVIHFEVQLNTEGNLKLKIKTVKVFLFVYNFSF